MQILPIIAAAIAGMVLGALWYSPLMFQNAWLAAIGKKPDELGSPAPAMFGSMLSCVVTASVLEYVYVSLMGAPGPGSGLALGALIGVGIVAMAMLSDSLFSDRGWKLYFIQAGYRVSYIVLMGAIIGSWPR